MFPHLNIIQLQIIGNQLLTLQVPSPVSGTLFYLCIDYMKVLFFYLIEVCKYRLMRGIILKDCVSADIPSCTICKTTYNHVSTIAN